MTRNKIFRAPDKEFGGLALRITQNAAEEMMMRTDRFNSIALQPLSRTSTTGTSSTVAPPPILDIERDTLQGPNPRTSNALVSKRTMKFAAMGTAAVGLVIGASVGIDKALATKNAGRDAANFATNKANYCAEFGAFTWVAPNFPGANVTDPKSFSSGSLDGNYINFYNQPQNLTSTCNSLYGSGKLVSNPNQTTVDMLNHFGPFPGSSAWLVVDSERTLGGTPPADIKRLYFHYTSKF